MLARQCGNIVHELTHAQSIDMAADFVPLRSFIIFLTKLGVILRNKRIWLTSKCHYYNIDDVLAQTASACRGSTEYQSWLRQTMQQRGPVKIGKRNSLFRGSNKHVS